jgi:hypothetical protein
VDIHTRLLVENILRRPQGFDWSVQGLGMMRLYLSEAVRLHIWDSSLRVPGVSAIHSHPWDLGVAIRCGADAGPVEDIQQFELSEGVMEVYAGSAVYSQSKDEIHSSCPEDGTITLVTRTFHEDRDHAMVYWRGRGPWVDAKPRPATPEEVAAVTLRALEAWF